MIGLGFAWNSPLKLSLSNSNFNLSHLRHYRFNFFCGRVMLWIHIARDIFIGDYEQASLNK
jgi:hypothetical protein